ncbi:MAG: AbrB/MazE/SpoVT family DNA-binding domain-containing protein [archaeon]
MDYAIARMSTKGQIVIPNPLREDFDVGEEFLVIKDKRRIVLRSMKSMARDLKDDLQFADKVEKAWQSLSKRKSKKMSKTDFLRELESW